MPFSSIVRPCAKRSSVNGGVQRMRLAARDRVRVQDQPEAGVALKPP